MKKYKFPVKGMTCASCVARIEKVVGKIEGIEDVRANLANSTISFNSDQPTDSLEAVRKAAEEYGYEIITGQNETKDERGGTDFKVLKNDFLYSLLFTLPVFIISMTRDMTQSLNRESSEYIFLNFVMLVLTTPVVFYSGRRFFIIAWKNIIHFSAEMNTLVAIGSGAAYIYSFVVTISIFFHETSLAKDVYFETASVIVTLILLGRMLEERSKLKTGEAVKKLLELRPQKAKVMVDGKISEIRAELLREDMMVLVKPGDRVPADGIIANGKSTLDESMMTGESLPVEKEVGDYVTGGTLNRDGSFLFRVSATGKKSVLGKIIELVEEAQSAKPPIQKMADKIASVFVPVVIVISLLTFLYWFFIGGLDVGPALVNFVAVLIIACPCALGLATPTAIITGTGRAAFFGLLVRDGESLEKAARVTHTAFDKTGTITTGAHKVYKIITRNEFDEEEALSLAASLEQRSGHPLAEAIVEYSLSKGIVLSEPDTFENLSGLGVTGRIGEKIVIVGNMKLMEENAVTFSKCEEIFNNAEESGATVIAVAIDNQAAALIICADSLRKGVKSAVKFLQELGVIPMVLSGDSGNAVRFISSTAGIYQSYGSLMPDEKVETIRRLQEGGKKIMMIGDGINDAPALAASEVGVAMGKGMDIALDSADVIIANENIENVPRLIKISRKIIGIIKQNLFWAFFYNSLMIPLAAAGVLNPMIAAMAMSLSSVTVVLNSLRLKKVKI